MGKTAFPFASGVTPTFRERLVEACVEGAVSDRAWRRGRFMAAAPRNGEAAVLFFSFSQRDDLG